MKRKGFFEKTENMRRNNKRLSIPLLPKCGQCGFANHCESPKLEVFGKGKKKILLVLGMPTQEDDENGKAWSGSESSKYIFETFKKLSPGIVPKRDFWGTYSFICRSENTKKHVKAIEFCRPNIFNFIKKESPNVIVLFGDRAIRSVLSPFYSGAGTGGQFLGEKGLVDKPVDPWRGHYIPLRDLNTWIIPTIAPSDIFATFRGEFGWKQEQEKGFEGHPVLVDLFQKDLKKALSLCKSKPYSGSIENLEKRVEIFYDAGQAVQSIKKIIEMGEPTAYDFETNGLLPYDKGFEIVCCSLSNGKRTISYLWNERTEKYTKRFLKSSIPKIASNLGFELIWSLEKMGIVVDNWFHDTMLGAHWLDSRGGISSIKFQAFVHLGFSKYDDHLEKYLKSDSPNKKNRVKEIDKHSLLLYCGLDSYLEWKVAQIQRKKGGLDAD